MTDSILRSYYNVSSTTTVPFAVVAAPLLLDSFSATGAYSTRKLRTAYAGSALRVRRSSDNAEQDIGFSLNLFDASALTTFCAGTDGFVAKWYDQSGAAGTRDAVQTTAANQPQIVSGGALLNTINGNAAITFDGASSYLTTVTVANLFIAITSGFTVFTSHRILSSASVPDISSYDQEGIMCDAANGFFTIGTTTHTSDRFRIGIYDGASRNASVGISFPQTFVGLCRWDKSTVKAYVDGGAGASTAATSNMSDPNQDLRFGIRYGVAAFFDGYMQEIILFNTQLSAADSNTLGASIAAYSGTSWSNIS